MSEAEQTLARAALQLAVAHLEKLFFSGAEVDIKVLAQLKTALKTLEAK